MFQNGGLTPLTAAGSVSSQIMNRFSQESEQYDFLDPVNSPHQRQGWPDGSVVVPVTTMKHILPLKYIVLLAKQ